MEQRRAVGIYLRGIAMGAADVVPGVSGGTVAFITGIYEELLASIKSIRPSVVGILFKDGVGAAWRAINGTFLLLLLAGIATSIFSLARIISHLLVNQPLLVWSFFFGLIAASSWHMIRQLHSRRLSLLVVLLIGAALAYLIGELKPSDVDPKPLVVFGAGAIAICAMILPGISGSFILVLLGLYGHILTAVKELNLVLLAVFAAGCGCGLLSFAHVLSWMFRRFHDATLALLTGFLLGSLSLVWPWKHTLSYYQNSKGESLALTQAKVWPNQFEALTGKPPQTGYCIALMVFGVFLVLMLEKIGEKHAQR